jgi:hypothetical protein
VWCQRLAPTWEAFAEHVETEKIPIKVAKVDCVTHAQLCKDQKVHAFPTLRLFNKASPLPPDYNTDRTVAALASYVTRKLNVEEKRKNWPERDREYLEHPGCMVRREGGREGGRGGVLYAFVIAARIHSSALAKE